MSDCKSFPDGCTSILDDRNMLELTGIMFTHANHANQGIVFEQAAGVLGEIERKERGGILRCHGNN